MYGSLVEAGGTLAGKAAELIFEKHLDESYFTLACATVSGLVTVLGTLATHSSLNVMSFKGFI